jgi:hypothetical protein
MKKIYNVDNHTIEFSEGLDNLDPWSSEYCKEFNLSLACTTDSVPYMRIDGEKIYNLRRSSCKYLDLIDCLENKAIVVTWEEVINNFDYLFDNFVGNFSEMKENLNELKRNTNNCQEETQMIGEDYVSFETAKLLKEKGFDEATLFRFDENGNLNSDGRFGNYNSLTKFNYVAAPTLQMTCKWLRKVHNLHIWVDYSNFDFDDKLPYLWNIRQTKIEGDYWGGTYHKSYEEACEEAIKYCLENLI